APRVDLDVDRFGRQRAGPFEISGEPSPAKLAALPGCFLSLGKTLPVRERENAVEDLFELASVVRLADMRAIGEILGAQEVAPAHLGGIDLHLARRLLHQALDQVVALGAPR